MPRYFDPDFPAGVFAVIRSDVDSVAGDTAFAVAFGFFFSRLPRLFSLATVELP